MNILRGSAALKGLCFLALLFSAVLLPAQETEGEAPLGGQDEESPLQKLIPRFKDRAVVLDIIARVVEQNQNVVWNEAHQKVTIPGRPVGLKLVGANVVVAVQFTPYFRFKGQKLLVAQGQIWMDVPNQGIRYHTSIQTIPLEFNEPIYFFPLGSANSGDQSHIEVMLTMMPYHDSGAAESTTANFSAVENSPQDDR